MHTRHLILVSFVSILVAALPSLTSSTRSFVIDTSTGTFKKDGEPFQLLSGSMHYFRHHPATYQDRLTKAKDCGLNAVQTYISWLRHEPYPGQYEALDDLTSFLDMANQTQILVVLRLGPYICAEYSFGGMPGWLFENGTDSISLRSPDSLFLASVDRWFTMVLLPLLKPYLYSNGGPVILAQIENEAGYYITDDGMGYLTHLYNLVRTAWGGPDSIIIHSTDGVNQTLLYNTGGIPNLFQTVDFGPSFTASGDPVPVLEDYFGIQDQANTVNFPPVGQNQQYVPHMNSELYFGGVNRNWGESAYVNDTEQAANSSSVFLQALVASGANFNAYMFSGGTNFGFEAGLHSGTSAKWNVGAYCPGAPLSEAGDPTLLYLPFCNAIYQGLQEKQKREAREGQNSRNTKPLSPSILPPILPPIAPKSHYVGVLAMTHFVPLWDALSSLITSASAISNGVLTPHSSYKPLTFEAMNLESGYALYTKQTRINFHSDLSNFYIREVRDRAYVFLNRSATPMVVLQRPLINGTWLPYPPFPANGNPSYVDPYPSTIDILVENEGRTCFGNWLNRDNKGLTSNAQLGTYANAFLYNWTSIPLPMKNITYATLANVWMNITNNPLYNSSTTTPTFYYSSLIISNTTTSALFDTFLDMRGWGKGFVTINGFNLGRFWYLGPEYSLYVPAGVLRYGTNDVVVFDADGIGAGCKGTEGGVIGEPSIVDVTGEKLREEKDEYCPCAADEDINLPLHAIPGAGVGAFPALESIVIPSYGVEVSESCNCRRQRRSSQPSFPVRNSDGCPSILPLARDSFNAPTITFREVPVRNLPQEEWK